MNLVDSRFHWKYFFIIVGSTLFFSTAAFSVAWYFIWQNYKIFIDFAYTNAPNFISNLEFEKKWILVILSCALIALNIAVAVYTTRVLNAVLYPLQVLKRHITNLTKGDWSQPEVKIRELTDYSDLVQTYNYFYRTLQRHSQHELHKLMSLEISKNAHRSREAWQSLVHAKYEQLNGSSLDFEKFHDSNHAS